MSRPKPVSTLALEATSRIANMTTESEMDGGGTDEDFRATLNALILEARRITGIDPEHPQVFCKCGVNRSECGCKDFLVPSQKKPARKPKIGFDSAAFAKAIRCEIGRRNLSFSQAAHLSGVNDGVLRKAALGERPSLYTALNVSTGLLGRGLYSFAKEG